MDQPQEGVELSRAHVEVVFDGDKLLGGIMEVADFAPAMLGIAEACQRANYLVNGNRARLSVQIKADVRNNCFHVDLDLVSLTSLVPLIPHFISSGVESAKSIAEFMFGDHFSVLDLLKRLGGEKAKNVEITSQGDVSLIIPGDNNRVVVNKNVYTIASDERERRAIAKAVRPVSRPGIDSLEIGTKTRKSIIEKKDIAAFGTPVVEKSDATGEVLENERDVILDVIAFATSEDQKSHFSDGESDLWATIADAKFWQDYHERTYGYFDGDRFRVKLRTIQHVGPKLKTEYVIEEVTVLPPDQTSLF